MRQALCRLLWSGALLACASLHSTGYKLVKLANGAHSIHSLSRRETFHPVIGPVAEAEALYVRQLRLVDRIRSHHSEFVIWDVGLGAAANALTVLRATRETSCSIRLMSFDSTIEPLQFGLSHARTLGYFHGYEPHLRALIGRQGVTFTGEKQTVIWELYLADFPGLLERSGTKKLAKPHVILFDAYSPATNPEMWTLPLFSNLFRLLDPARPCSLPTYSRSTMLRVTLLLAGFYVGAGHATGEKEETTIAANALDLINEPLDRLWLQRARRSTSAEPLHEPVYRQTKMSSETWEHLQEHPQFK